MTVVVVRESVSVADGQGGFITLHRGDAWDSEHPIVKAHRDCFSEFAPIERGGVEQATAAPGERRGRPR